MARLILLTIGMAMVTWGTGQAESVQCVLNGRHYALGDTWHPVVPPFGFMPCVNCTCSQSGEVDCRSQTCPKPECPHPKITPNQCCPTCEDIENVPPTVTEAEAREKPDPSLDCEFYGDTFSDGDKFPSNRTALQPTREGQCVLCVCTRGRVLCHLKSCPAVRCRDGYINVANDCCPKCKDCLGVDGVRLNGTTWSPSVPPFGLMKCVQCTCLNGRIECSRKKCPDEKTLRCKRPRKAEGECCSTCRKGGKRRPHRNPGSSTPAPAFPVSRKPKGKPVVPTSRLTENTLRQLCLARRTDRLVYRTNTSSSVSVVFDILKKSRVEVMTWTIRRGRLSVMRREMLPADDYRKQTNVSDIVGSTNKRHYKKFKRRLSRQFKRCEKKRSCRLKHLSKALRKMRTKKIRFSNDCTKN
ncbi:chordin-like [Liolophura sinensis]|uniref:chordin-like n=1 Tax=Liolophura sinensis TaxID=3198878 RepID=UPI0031582C18